MSHMMDRAPTAQRRMPETLSASRRFGDITGLNPHETNTGANHTRRPPQSATPWVWLYSEKCAHSSPLACAVPVIRWGADTSVSDFRF
jgi:hypothetical protein